MPSGIDTPHYYPVIVKYIEHLKQYGLLPNWFHWWYGGYPESTFNSLAILIVVYISYVTKITPALLYNLTRLLSHIFLGVASGIYAQSLTRSRISAFFAMVLTVSSIELLENCGIIGRFPTVVALPFLVLTLYFSEKQINSKKFLSKESILFSFSLALCVSIHSMVAYIALLLLFLRLVAAVIFKKHFLRTLGGLILSIIFSFLLASYFLMRLIYEKKLFENLFWPPISGESLHEIMKGYFSWTLGEGPIFFGAFLLIIFTLYLLNTVIRGIKERDFFLLVSVAFLFVLSWGPSERQFLWSVLPMHTGFDSRRFAVVGSLLLCIAGGIGSARLLTNKEFRKVNVVSIRVFIPLLLVFVVLEALPLKVGFNPIQLSKGVVKLETTLKEKSQGRIYTSGFRHFHALLVPLLYDKELVGGWFYQGALNRNYLEAAKSFGQQIPSPRIENYAPRNPALFSNLLWWFNCKYIILGYDWFERSKIGYVWDTYHPKTPVFKPICVLFKDRVIGGWPASDFRTSNLEKMLKKYPNYFSPYKLYGEVNVYKLNNFDKSHSFLTKNPLLFIGPEENYRRLFLALNSIDAGHSLVLVRGRKKLENIAKEFKTIIIYGIPLSRQTYSKIDTLSQAHRVIFIQDDSVINGLDFFNKVKPRSEIGKVEYRRWNGAIETQDIILKYYDHFFPYYSIKIKENEGYSLMQLNGKNIIVKKQNLILSGFDLPKHAYYFNDKKELNFLVQLLSFPGSSSTISPADFKRKNADEFIVSSKDNGWIVIKEAYFPYWKVLNKNREIYKAGPNFMLTKIQAGQTLHFKFIPSCLRKIALVISLIVLCTLISVYYMRNERAK